MSDPTRKRLLERTFKYVPASKTNVAATFARIRRQLKEDEAAKLEAEKHAPKLAALPAIKRRA